MDTSKQAGYRRFVIVSAALSAVLLAGLIAPAGATAMAKTKRMSTLSGGGEPDGDSFRSSVSNSGRFIAFDSGADDLIGKDLNVLRDVFVYDRKRKKTRRVSISSKEAESVVGNSQMPAITRDGRFVAFESAAVNLAGPDFNDSIDIFVRDSKKGRTRRVSIRKNGLEPSKDSLAPSISTNGRFVAFESSAADIVKNDANGKRDVFVQDRKTRRIKRVSVHSDGTPGDGDSFEAVISANGRYVAFASKAKNLINKDTNSETDVFVHDRKTKKTKRVSRTYQGKQSSGGSSDKPAISADGRFIVFASGADDLVASDTNGREDIFLRDLVKKRTRRVNVSSTGRQAENGDSWDPAISADGRIISFTSDAIKLIVVDSNGDPDVYFRDRKRKKTKRASVSNAGSEVADGSGSFNSAVSGDGQFITFESNSNSLVGGDAAGKWDIFRRGPLR